MRPHPPFFRGRSWASRNKIYPTSESGSHDCTSPPWHLYRILDDFNPWFGQGVPLIPVLLRGNRSSSLLQGSRTEAQKPVSGGSVSLEDARIDDDNVLHRLDYPKKQEEFWSYLVSRKSDIEAIVRFHLRAKHCQVADESQWLYGSYNVCIPVYIKRPSEDRVLVRIPLPYKIGEANNPGNVDEKLRCEVATYIWIREHCPTVPIPSLYAFAFPNGQTFRVLFLPNPLAHNTNHTLLLGASQKLSLHSTPVLELYVYRLHDY
ncbi:hypothetical protein FQN55_006803 [Onygenales sp. PD_40]|nr:hypothetical protein FQN55_006803 [Onygenales sp. PD_40]